MKQCITVITTPTISPWLNNLLESIEGYHKYPIIIVSNYGYELGKLKLMYDYTNFDEILLLQETVEIKKTELFDKIFVENVGKSVAIGTGSSSYLIKYRREILDKTEIPIMQNKDDSIHYERVFNNEYWDKEEKDKKVHLFDDFPHKSDIFEDKFGRKNMKIENDYLIKWKARYN